MATAALCALPVLAMAHDEDAGSPARAAQATRTVTFTASDRMQFEPARLEVTRGQIVRLRIVNAGKLPHEFVLGTAAQIDAHAKMMRDMPNMVHEDASSIRIAPGATGQIVWRFDKAGTFTYACLIAGHFEAGMHGVVVVTDRAGGRRRARAR